ncbi:hypothetical protein BJA01nite_66760 [Bradyrhizobium japonicum]|nr:hypothetical protein BJ6T_34930 [Bradyrhizobium japonicum USDA 6]GEC49034.1 hypothetical protein BJA01nite_66760 [Bradyrhizobium japonicum]
MHTTEMWSALWGVERRSHHTLAVIARLDRRSSIPEALAIGSRGRDVLDAPPAAYAKASALLDLNPGEALAQPGRGA